MMISSITNAATPYSFLNRAGSPPARSLGSAVSTAEETVVRAIDDVTAGFARNAIENTMSQEDPSAAGAPVAGIGETDQEDVAGSAASLIAAKTGFRATLAVLKTSDEMTGRLLDIFA